MPFPCPLCSTVLTYKYGIYPHLSDTCVNRHLLPNLPALNGPQRLAAAMAVATARAGGVPAPQPATFSSNNHAAGVTGFPPRNSHIVAVTAPYATIGRGVAPLSTPITPSTPSPYNLSANNNMLPPLSSSQRMAATSPYAPIGRGVAPQLTRHVPSTPNPYNTSANSNVLPPLGSSQHMAATSSYTATGRGVTSWSAPADPSISSPYNPSANNRVVLASSDAHNMTVRSSYATMGRGVASRPTPTLPSSPYSPYVVNRAPNQVPPMVPSMGVPTARGIPTLWNVPPLRQNPLYDPNRGGYSVRGCGSTPVVRSTFHASSDTSSGRGRANATLATDPRFRIPLVNITEEEYLPSPLYSLTIAPPLSPGKEYPDPTKFKAYRP